MAMKPYLLLLVIGIAFYAPTHAQQPIAAEKTVPVSALIKKTKLTLLSGVIAASKLHYFGRTDSLKSSALLPTLLVQLDSVGIYVAGTSVFLQNKTQSLSYAGTIAEAGYRFGKLKGFAGNIFANKFFYNISSLPQSSLQAQAGININYLNKILNVMSSGSAAFSNGTDFFAAAGINHNFSIVKNKSVFVITPTASANGGTQNFELKTNNNNGIGGLFPNNGSNTTQKKFQLLSLDFSLPVVWTYKNIFLIATPTFIVPKNVIPTASNPTGTIAGNLFFVNVTALYALKF